MRSCESLHSVPRSHAVTLADSGHQDRTISKDEAFDDCVILSRETFDPDAVFLDDIVDDEVLPYLSLAVDGLTTAGESRKGKLDLRPDDAAANEEMAPDTVIPQSAFDPTELEVYGWESPWRKFKTYLGF